MEKGVTERWSALYFLKNVNENEGKPVEKPACLRFTSSALPASWEGRNRYAFLDLLWLRTWPSRRSG